MEDPSRTHDDVTSSKGNEARSVPEMYLVITNIAKLPNVKKLLLSAAAFGCNKVLVVGQKTFDVDPDGKDIPIQIKNVVKSGKMPVQRFSNWNECVDFLKERKVKLVGVEIHEDAKDIEDFFNGESVAFLMGNEGDGLNEKQLKSCDAFVRIRQYGSGTASLNVYVAASIVLSRFHHYQLGYR